MKFVSAAEFKAKCLKLMDEVQAGGEPITITKRGKPVATLQPLAKPPGERPASLFGSMKDSMTVHGDIVAPLDPDWEAKWDASHPPEMYGRVGDR